ncbi:hypothetical protein KI387_003066, partial [Taxus chinensis]
EGDTQKTSVIVEKIRKHIMTFTQDLANAKNLGKEVASTIVVVYNLKDEINLTKLRQSKACNDDFKKLKMVMEEIKNTNERESNALYLLELINSELTVVKEHLKK